MGMFMKAILNYGYDHESNFQLLVCSSEEQFLLWVCSSEEQFLTMGMIMKAIFTMGMLRRGTIFNHRYVHEKNNF